MQLCQVSDLEIFCIGKVIKNTKKRFQWNFKVHIDQDPEHLKCYKY
jgi:hypothetical protein